MMIGTSPTDRKTKTHSLIFGAIVGVFLLLRLLWLGSDYICEDQVSLLSGGLTKIPWGSLPETVLQETLATTNPFLPMLLVRILNNLFGPHILILRLPAVLTSLLSLCLLHRVLSECCSKPGAVYLPQILFTLSIPSLIYSRQIHQSIYYFFTTGLQIYVFWAMVQELTPTSSLPDIRRKIQIFTRISLFMLLANWMSILIYMMLMGSYLIIILIKQLSRPHLLKHLSLVILEVGIEAVPLGILAYLRFRMGGAVRPYFKPHYYADSLLDIPKQAYDLINYHFNFAYTTDLYTPLGANLLTLPFVALFLIGVIYFFLKRPWLLWPGLFAVLLLSAIFAFKLVPFGGVRHSFILAPFLFIFIGYGVEALYAITSHLNRPVAIAHWSVITYALLAIGTFLYSGSHLYIARNSRIDLKALADFAAHREISTIAGLQDAYNILIMMDYTQGNRLKDNGIQFKLLGNDAYNTHAPSVTTADKNYFVVTYMRPLSFNLQQKRVTALREDFGLLLHHPPINQSIYYPLNGFFAYFVEEQP